MLLFSKKTITKISVKTYVGKILKRYTSLYCYIHTSQYFLLMSHVISVYGQSRIYVIL